MQPNEHADLDTITERLQALNARLDRQLDAAFEPYGVSSDEFLSLRHFVPEIDARVFAEKRSELEAKLPPSTLSWEEISLPDPETLARPGLHFVRI